MMEKTVILSFQNIHNEVKKNSKLLVELPLSITLFFVARKTNRFVP